MIIVQSNMHSSNVFVDNNMTYIGPFVIPNAYTTNYHIYVDYRGWRFVFCHRHGKWYLQSAYAPTDYVCVLSNHRLIRIITRTSNFTICKKYDYKLPNKDTEFNINFICGRLRRDVFAHGPWYHFIIFTYKPLLCWLNTYKN